MVSIAAFQAVDPGSIPGRRNIFSTSGRHKQEKDTILTFPKIYSIPGVQKGFPTPGIEPGPPGWEPGILTTRPYRTDVSDAQLGRRYTLVLQKQESTLSLLSSIGETAQPIMSMPLWRNRLARSAVNRKVGGSSPPGGEHFLLSSHE